MNDKQAKVFYSFLALLFMLAFFVGIKTSENKNAPSPMTPPAGASTAPEQSTSQIDPQDDGMSYLAISVERAAEPGQLVCIAFQQGPAEFVFKPSVTDQVTSRGFAFATKGLQQAHGAGMFWWSIMDMQSSQSKLLSMDARQAGPIPESVIGNHNEIMRGKEKECLLLKPNALEVRLLERELSEFPLQSPSTQNLTRVEKDGVYQGTCFTDISAREVYALAASRQNLQGHKLPLFPQTLATDNGNVYAFGITTTKNSGVATFRFTEPGFANLGMRLLSPKPVPHSAGIGHAGVYTDKSTNRQLALINYWDDPHLIQFELATGKEITRYPLGQFYTTPPSSVEARQSVELDCEDRWFAMTCEGTHRHGEKESTLIIAHGNELSVLHAKGISNGLCVGKKWLAWDLRRTEAGQTDEVWLIYLPGDLTEASAQKLPIAQSSTSRPLPSFMALNEQ